MITGQLMFDVEIEVDNKEEAKQLSLNIIKVCQTVSGVVATVEVDSDLEESEEESSSEE